MVMFGNIKFPYLLKTFQTKSNYSHGKDLCRIKVEDVL